MRWQPFMFAAVMACKVGGDVAPVTQDPLPSPTSIVGTVTDARTGRPIPTAVYGIVLGGGEPILSIPVDANGRFNTTDVVAGGFYFIGASAAGYAPTKVQVLTRKDTAVRADVRLAPAQAAVSATPSTLELGLEENQITFQLANASGAMAHYQIVAPAAWVTSVTPAEGMLAANSMVPVAVRVDRSLLTGFGAHSTLLTVVFDGGATFVDLRLNNVNGNAPQLSYDVATLDFGTTETSLTFDVSNVGSGMLHWSVAAGAPEWLSFTPSSGTVAAGQHTTVTATSDRRSYPPSSIIDDYFTLDSDSVVDTVLPIRGHLETPGATGWTLDRGTLALSAGAVSDVVKLTNTGTLPLDWNATANDSWVAASPSSGRLLPGDVARVYVGVDVSHQAVGAFATQLTFSSEVGALPLPVTGTRVLVPLLEVPQEVTVEAVGRGNVSATTWVNNVGEGSISWTASTLTPWIILTPTAGSSSANISCAFAIDACGTQVNFAVNLDAMPDGSTSIGTINVATAGGAEVRTITVLGRVRLTPFHWDAARPGTPAKLARTMQSMAVYDPVRDRVVLAGGGNPQAPPSDRYSDCSNGTWEFDGRQWREVVTAAAPALGCMMSPLVFDRRRGVVVYVGAGTAGTWEFDGANWTKTVGAAQTNYFPTAPAWSPELRSIVMVNYVGSSYRLLAYQGGTWVDVAAAPPVANGMMLLSDETTFWSLLPNGVSYDLDLVDDRPLYTTHYGPAVHALVGGFAFDQWNAWLYGISSSYVDGGYQTARGRLLSSNLRTGGGVNEALPADFGERVAPSVAVDTARRRAVVVGGTYCDIDLAGCAPDYGKAVPTAFLDFQPPGVTYEEHPQFMPSTETDHVLTTLDFGTSSESLKVIFTNQGTGELDYSGDLPAGFSSDLPYAPLASAIQFTITLDRSRFSAGLHSIPWPIRSDGGNRTITLQFTNP